MIRFMFTFDKDKETKWLNEYVAKGYAMKRFFAGIYWFEECEKDQYTYQIDFVKTLFHVNKDYREFMEDTKVEIVQSWGPWVFLRKLKSLGEFELYTDTDSMIEHYQKIKKMLLFLLALELFVFLYEIVLGVILKANMGYLFALIIGAFSVWVLFAYRKTSNLLKELQLKRS